MQRKAKNIYSKRTTENRALAPALLIFTEILAITGPRLFPASMVLQSCHLFKKCSPQVLSMLSKVRIFLRFSMGSTGAKTLLIAVAALMWAGTASAWDYDSIASDPQTGIAQSADVEQVRQLLARMVELWNAHDLERYLDCYWNSPDLLVVIDSQQNSGWQELHDSYMRGYHNRVEMGHVIPSRLQIRLAKPDLALALFYWTVNFPTSKHIVVGIDTFYVQRFGNGWKIVSDHTSTADM
jgi:uncharacterized protein (TIGR02246 family)